MLLQAAAEIAPVHQCNPRRVKAFINRCRLGLYLLKLDFPEMIQEDYLEAVEAFKKWEVEVAKGAEAGDERSGAAHDFWHSRLREVRQCLFAGSAR